LRLLWDRDHDDLSDRIQRALDQDRPVIRKDTFIGRTIANRFVVESKIGAGGMGAVYRARQLGMDRDVAIKVLLQEFTANPLIIKRFHMEALAVSKLQHPNTIRIFDFGQTEDSQLFIAMEFLRGHSLEHELRENKSVAVNRVLHVISQVCGSLGEAHDKSIVHRDLKPDNIFLCPVGKDKDYAKVLDFGVAKLKSEDRKQGTLTEAGMVFGTPRYMSPEQCRSDSTDQRSDIYALGVIMYEMLTGRAPFEADNPLSILIMHVQDAVKPLDVVRPDLLIPAALQRAVYRCLEKNPDKRYASAHELGDDLDAIARTLDTKFDAVVTRDDAEALGIDLTREDAFTLPRPAPGVVSEIHLQGQVTEQMDPEARDAFIRREIRRKRVKQALAVAAVVVALFTAGVLALLLNLPSQPPGYQRLFGAPVVALGSLPEFRPDAVRLVLTSDPPGAAVYDDEHPLGRTPLAISRLREDRAVPYTFRLDRHETHTLSVSLGADGDWNAELSEIKPTEIIREVVREVMVPRPVPVDRPAGRDGRTGGTTARTGTSSTPSTPAEPRKPATFQGGRVDTLRRPVQLQER
jgi:serine/threonine protein kinase